MHRHSWSWNTCKYKSRCRLSRRLDTCPSHTSTLVRSERVLVCVSLSDLVCVAIVSMCYCFCLPIVPVHVHVLATVSVALRLFPYMCLCLCLYMCISPPRLVCVHVSVVCSSSMSCATRHTTRTIRVPRTRVASGSDACLCPDPSHTDVRSMCICLHDPSEATHVHTCGTWHACNTSEG